MMMYVQLTLCLLVSVVYSRTEYDEHIALHQAILKLKHVKSLHDLHRLGLPRASPPGRPVNIMPISLASTGLRNRKPLSNALPAVSMHHRPQMLFVDDMETIISPIQSEDSCMKMNVCVTVPVHKEPHIFHFPECIELSQCLGSCCDQSHSCHARVTSKVKVWVSKWSYERVNDNFQWKSMEGEWVVMEKHSSCGCRTCRSNRGINSTQCQPPREVLEDCRCACPKNIHSNCPGNKIWDVELCGCKCISVEEGCKKWNEEHCFCEPDDHDVPATVDFSDILAKKLKLPNTKRLGSPLPLGDNLGK